MIKIITFMLLASATFIAYASAAHQNPPSEPSIAIATTLDAFHRAASKADFEGYFALFAPNGVFLGTDATERWTVDEFKAYAKPHFDKGTGWTYTPVAGKRFITIAGDGKTAWFDELLDNVKYGTCRGSGVLTKIGDNWRIAQYNLAFTIPNDAANDVAALIKAKKNQRRAYHPPRMLILFDIDGTILLTQSAGIHAMQDAGRELWGDHFTIDGCEFSGRLDTLIWNDLTRINGVENSAAQHDLFRATYGRMLAQRLTSNPTAMLLPGVKELVHELVDIDHATVGLLTGNYPETGRLKIQQAGLDPDLFRVAAWGIDGKTRRDLPPVAMQRHTQLTGRQLRGEEVVIIGDTPHDIDCARAHSCRSIGVATGVFSVGDLEQSGADLAVESLADTSDLLRWMFETPAAVSK